MLNFLYKRFAFVFILNIIPYMLYAIKVYNISDYNIKEGMDVTPIIREIFEENDDNFKIVFQKGTYHFYPECAFGKYHEITNHDNIYRYIAFPIIGKNNVEIDGGGAEFIFHGVITPFVVEKSTSVTLSNLSIDWEKPFYLQAEVVDSNIKERWMDLKIFHECEPFFEGNRLGFMANGVHLPFLGECMPFDPKTKAVLYKGQNNVLNTETSRSTFDEKKDSLYRINWPLNKNYPPEKGAIYVAKGPNGLNRYCPAFHLHLSKDVTMLNITIHHAGGMGIIGERTENIHLDKVNVALKSGTDRIVTTSADATHFCGCKGNLIIENCLFENMFDDATNIHGSYGVVHKIIDKKNLLVRLSHFQQFGYVIAVPGDSVSFVNKENLSPLSYNVVSEVKEINDKMYKITFCNDISDNINVGDGMENITWYPNTIFRNNMIRNNKARGILVNSRNKTLVENNTFSSMMAAILVESDMYFWHESGAVRNLEIKNNVFLDNVYGGRKHAVITISPRIKNNKQNKMFGRAISIENNEFRTFDNAILSAVYVDGISFTGNKIVETNSYKKVFPKLPAIDIKKCMNVYIKSNSYTGNKKAQISLDEFSKKSSQVDMEQSGFIIK